MKQVLRLAFGALLTAGMGAAATCGSGNLSSYVSLGSGGCTIGGDTLSNFQILSGISGATEISPAAVTITPTGSTFSPGLTISTTQTASNGSLLEVIFTYQISGQMYVGAAATLGGSSETGFGAVTGIENFCGGGSFGADGVSGCTGESGALLTLDGPGGQQTDMSNFGKVAYVNVTNDLTFDASGGGTASGGTFANSFTVAPEPVSTGLAGLGLALVGVYRKRSLGRSKRSNQEEII